jgi:phospholipid/cholesterol/gamma-HCH transport system substrate-binding protein
VETKEIAQQVKLGAFVLAGVTLFLISVFFIGSENNIFSRTFTISAIFKNVEGLKEGDNVWLSGVKIGTVKNVRIVSEGRVVVDLSLKDRQNDFIRKDATAFVGSDGLVGNKIVVIRPGTSQQIVHDNDTINTDSPPDTQQLIGIAKDVGENTRSLTGDLKVIAQKIKDGQGVVGELLNDGAIAKELRMTITNLRTTGENTAKASAELHALLYDLKHGDGLLPALISDTGYVSTFNEAMVNVKKVSVNANSLAQNLQSLSARMNEKENALGVLLADSSVATNLRQTIQHAESASQKLDENMTALQHNFLLRGYFKKQDKKKAKEQEKEPASSQGY